MITLQLKRPSGTGHHPEAKIYFVSFDGINHRQSCTIYHRVWEDNASSVDIRSGANFRSYRHPNLKECIAHALSWAERVRKSNLKREA